LDYGLVARAFEINAVGPLRLTETCLKQGLLGDGAKIAFVSSRLGSIASNTQLGANYAYRMSKSALNAAGRSLAVDLRPRGLAVVLLHPGYVATPMTGDRGDVVAAVSAAGLFRRVVALNMSASGSFIDYGGRQVPW
jgi:NAD(P)-dependent dehydrogenase (short-subunit alcohol dehydrogenase family)